MAKQLAFDKVAATGQPQQEAQTKPQIPRYQVPGLAHVYQIDINEDGLFREVAIMKEDESGSIVYIDVALLDGIDKQRLKKIVTGTHANKYALWELMDQERLSNGANALDYFHQMGKTKRLKGHVNTTMGGSLLGVQGSDRSIAGNFTNPDAAGQLGQ